MSARNRLFISLDLNSRLPDYEADRYLFDKAMTEIEFTASCETGIGSFPNVDLVPPSQCHSTNAIYAYFIITSLTLSILSSSKHL
jgi:hypothetical protein